MIIYTDDPSWLHAYSVEHEDHEEFATYFDSCLIKEKPIFLSLPAMAAPTDHSRAWSLFRIFDEDLEILRLRNDRLDR